MSSWSEERRLNLAAEAAEHRKNKDADAERRRKEREAEDQRHREERRRDREEARQDKAQRRRDRAQRRQARAAKREKNLTPANVYRKGTLALVGMSAAAAIPAQVLYFVGIGWMLLPVPFALEGAAWVMAAGVAHADEKKLAPWVRWLLRVLSMSAAAFAARINYLHGSETSTTVGWGLAAVTMLGPLFFEVRQWVSTLTASTASPKQQAEDKARRRHEKRRRKDHKDVVGLADKLISAAPYGSLKPEDAFAKAWLILKGTPVPGMTPELHAKAAESAAALAKAQPPQRLSAKDIRERIARRLDVPVFVLPTASGTPMKRIGNAQVVSDIPPSSETTSKGGRKRGWKKPPPHRRRGGDSTPFHPLAKVAAADTARKHMAVNGSH